MKISSNILGEILGKLYPEDKKELKTDKKSPSKVLLLLTIGILLVVGSNMIVGMYKGNRSNNEKNSAISPEKDRAVSQSKESLTYEEQMERRLKSILKKMQGVGEVEVMITTTYGKEIVLAEDVTSHITDTREEDQEGGTREINNSNIQKKIVMQNGNVASGNSPVVVKEKQPEIQGVLVVAQGANNSMVKQAITESAQTLLGIPAHRVTVYQLQSLNK